MDELMKNQEAVEPLQEEEKMKIRHAQHEITKLQHEIKRLIIDKH